MNDTGAIVDRQVDRMVRLVRRYEASEIEKILDRAYATARERVRAARRDARQRVHEAVGELRSEMDTALTRIRAGDEARMRRHELGMARLVLAEGHEVLARSVRARWQDPPLRDAWVSSLLEQATAVLPAGEWEVEHAADWPDDEREAFSARVREATGQTPKLDARDDIAAGLRIGIGGASLDATLDGLLARGEELEARLLAEYYALRDGPHGAGGELSDGGSSDGGSSDGGSS